MKKVILKAGTLSKQDVLNQYNNQIQENFDELSAVASTTSISTKTVNLQVNASTFIIAGDTFVPPITKQPSIFTAIVLTGDNGDTADIIQGFIKNGDYYDVVITPLDEIINNVKISVI